MTGWAGEGEAVGCGGEQVEGDLVWGPGFHASGPAAVDADAYFRHVGRWSALFLDATLAAAKVAVGARVLDVATGPGEAARRASFLVGTRGSVICSDISMGMLRAVPADQFPGPCHRVVADAQGLPFAAASVDAVICQLGLMFVPEPVRAVREFGRVLKPGGRAAVCVISTPERAPVWGALAVSLGRVLPRDAQTLMLSFSLADPAVVADLFEGAGFADVEVTTERRMASLGSLDAYWDLVAAGVGQLPHAYRSLDERARRTVRGEVGDRLSGFEVDGRLELPIEMIITSGQMQDSRNVTSRSTPPAS